MYTPEQIIATLYAHADPVRAKNQLRFFKTGPGQYGEGDIFWGITNPLVRNIVKQHKDTSLETLEALLEHSVHEVRLCALLLLVAQFPRATEEQRAKIIALYLRRTERVNNWDLVDLSACLLGEWLRDKNRDVLDRLAASPLLWDQRIAVVTTLTFIRHKDFADILRLAPLFMNHPHDLMHKAVGWALREVGKKDLAVLSAFLDQYVQQMPRTMLRYAIEKYPEAERKAWLQA